jgi:putative oxidoreductase
MSRHRGSRHPARREETIPFRLISRAVGPLDEIPIPPNLMHLDRRLLIGHAPLDSPAADLGRALLRVGMGLSLALAHGLGKLPPSERFIGAVERMGFPLPELFAWLAAFAELGGGLLLALGLLTRPMGLFVAGHFAVVVLLAHAGDPFGDREDGLLFGLIALFFGLAGAGRYSVDALLRRQSEAHPDR